MSVDRKWEEQRETLFASLLQLYNYYCTACSRLSSIFTPAAACEKRFVWKRRKDFYYLMPISFKRQQTFSRFPWLQKFWWLTNNELFMKVKDTITQCFEFSRQNALMLKMGLLLWFANNVNRLRQNGENFMVRKVLKSQFCMLKFDKRLCFWHQSSRCYHRDERVTADKDERGQKTLLCVKSKSSHFLTNAAANPHFSNPPRACPVYPWACGMYPYFRDTYLTPLLFPNVTF